MHTDDGHQLESAFICVYLRPISRFAFAAVCDEIGLTRNWLAMSLALAAMPDWATDRSTCEFALPG
jgi:hypothetical protein